MTRSHTKTVLRSGLRVLTGLLSLGIAGTGVILLQDTGVFEERVAALHVDQNITAIGERPIVCNGAFAELGANPNDPEAAAAVGSLNMQMSGETLESYELEWDGAGASPSLALRLDTSTPYQAVT